MIGWHFRKRPYPREARMRKHRRYLFSERRLGINMPRFPFEDSVGVMVTECRRRIADRRIASIKPKRLKISVIN